MLKHVIVMVINCSMWLQLKKHKEIIEFENAPAKDQVTKKKFWFQKCIIILHSPNT